ncbi:uncharacterized protein LOC135134795 [Zophobas morio]|uniref:uncharacterized protein LOC135134795 n=1 Tax=Zophobas morio TaxID=2755281 RepID=UPI0030828F9E
MEKFEWTKSTMEKFIIQFEKYPCLYDVKHQFYKNKHARAEAYNKIVETLKKENEGLKVTVEEAKKKITNLRSQYNHELNKIRASTHSGMGTDEIYEPTVWWFEKLQFLEQFIKPRKGKSSIDVLHDNENQSQPNFMLEEIDNDLVTDLEDIQESGSNDVLSSSMSSGLNASLQVLSPKPVQRAKNRKTSAEDDVIMTKTLKVLEEINRPKPKIDEVCEFGRFVSKELQGIDDEELQNEAKHEINNILYHFKKQFIQRKKIGIEINDV